MIFNDRHLAGVCSCMRSVCVLMLRHEQVLTVLSLSLSLSLCRCVDMLVGVLLCTCLCECHVRACVNVDEGNVQ